MSVPRGLGWFGIIRLGLVQAALGGIVVLTTSTLNRVMVVELALPALVPGALVALHHVLQVLRPRFGHGSDTGGRRTPWIIGGMATLGVGAILAALATAWMTASRPAGLALAVGAFTLIGVGVGAAGTSLLVLLAKCVDAPRRAAAASIVWVMMIAGFVVTAGAVGHFLDPYTPARLVLIAVLVALLAFSIAVVAIRGVEDRAGETIGLAVGAGGPQRVAFRDALADVWSEAAARRFTVFIFVSMLAFSAQDLILEPFAGTVFGLTPGESTSLSAIQNGGVLTGMVLLAFAAGPLAGRRHGSLEAWTIGGCIASAAALSGLALAGFASGSWPLRLNVFALGLANGVFSVAAIGSMMALVGTGHASREGLRMGLWGAAQAIAFAVGGILGTGSVDLARWLTGSPQLAYSTVFAMEAAAFLVAALLAARVGAAAAARPGPGVGAGALMAGSTQR